MMLPLTNTKEHKQADANGNCGLYFNKFFDGWPSEGEVRQNQGKFELAKGRKPDWLKLFTTASAKVEAKRIYDLAIATSQPEIDADAENALIPVEYTTTGPFITGMGLSHPVENGFLWHHTLGVPYLPGSSIKGMIRAWAEHWCGESDKDIGRIFGRDDKAAGGAAAGNIIVFDALPTAEVELYVEVITPHTGDWRITDDPEKSPPADWVSPVPIPFLAIKQGAKFQFALAARKGADTGDLKKAYDYLEEALEWIGAGAKTAVGFGRFENNAKAEAEKKAIEASRPPQKGDRVEILDTYAKEAFRGRKGIVDMVYGTPQAKLNLDGGGKGSSPVVPLEHLKRI